MKDGLSKIYLYLNEHLETIDRKIKQTSKNIT